MKPKRRYPLKDELHTLRVEVWHLESQLLELQRRQRGSIWKQLAHHEAAARQNAVKENWKLRSDLDEALQWSYDMSQFYNLDQLDSAPR
ncbi:unnamed protein product [Aphanomyces euteiches]|uniref:Uncharacterized protein n=1 Tax=Aphanomyces euteiches TaxID=100861 RepID=A0A6G0WIK5_9STRA|nr:hypothetical protein Ae201684_014796 [Aphanomyces euteiches]KAH9072734.1 hypothetical protein Ae201684P_015805 [Aphanomyces euteiches]KAH9142580.1 hypothetical protein AeRB84_013350 [Aphanomyces euteiches]